MSRKNLKQFLRDKRKEVGDTQFQAATKIGVQAPIYSRWELGAEPSVKYLAEIQKYLEIDDDELAIALLLTKRANI